MSEAAKPPSSLPFLPYGRQTVDETDIEAVASVLRGDFLTTGPTVAAFEAAVARVSNRPWAVAVSSGTAALHAACFALDLKPGDKVLVPAITFLATANSARYLGAEPEFVDVDPNTGLIDLADLERRLDANTRLVMPVHMTGALADTEGVKRLADAVGAAVIEDASHALGAQLGEHVALSTFSFHPVKHATTGEGGAVTGSDPKLQERLRSFRNHCMQRVPSQGPWYYEQHELGFNYRLTDIAAALGVSQLAKLDGFIAQRRRLAAVYDAAFAEFEGIEPVSKGSQCSGSAYHLYSVLIDFDALGCSREALMQHLRADGIGSQVHYIPLPMQPYYVERGARTAEYPGAVSYYEHTLSLPLFPAMDEHDVQRVVASLRRHLKGNS